MELIADIVGIIGVSFVIFNYLLLQAEKLTPTSSFYLYSNFFGSLLLLFSLYYHWNLASVVIEMLWLLISIYGIIRAKILKKI
ncbi:MAG: hypothetical protein P8P83_04150 [Rickettsiaceae bacterium]|nr:hypothetical protein [Rickettsiaceae bacterium]